MSEPAASSNRNPEGSVAKMLWSKATVAVPAVRSKTTATASGAVV